MSPVLHYALPVMGVCRNYPRALVFSPTKYSGIGIKHIHTLQEIAWIKDIIQHVHDKTTTGQLYQTTLEHLILEVGVNTNLTLVDFSKYNILATNSLIKSTWGFLYENQITIEHNITVPKNTVNDIPIMLQFIQLPTTSEELVALNQCHLYLQAYFVSDLATASGETLSYHAWEGT
jgi:hypothetical protein